MMNVHNNLKLFQELISCSHKLYLWSYTPDLTLISTNCPTDMIDGNSFFMINQSEPLLKYAQNGHRPFVMDSFLNILWIADFEWEGDKLQKIHMIGPTFSGGNSYQKLKEKLDAHNLSVQAKIAVLKQLDEIPILPTNLLFQYAIMLHYCITEEKISSQDLQYPAMLSEEEGPKDIQNISDEHPGIWASEQMLVKMFREGNPNYKDALEKSSTLSSGVKFNAGDSLRHSKNNMIVLLTLCSRAAIEGGLSPSISYTLCDYYTQRCEDAGSISEMTILSRTMLEDYMQRVRQSRADSTISRTVQSCCDYISVHVNEKLSIEFLSQRAGYTEYYFSRKFKQETGYSISEFIKREKIRKAQTLLCSTNMSILEISNELSFSSRSYFSDTFQKITGESPGEYRKHNLKI